MLAAKAKVGGPSIFFAGALAASSATFVGYYPWFYAHNYLQEKLPKPDKMLMRLCRNALIGILSSFVSDIFSNGIRVVKTVKQTSSEIVSYPKAVAMVIQKDGITGLLFRGLATRVWAHGIQSMVFTVAWKFIEEEMKFNKKTH